MSSDVSTLRIRSSRSCVLDCTVASKEQAFQVVGMGVKNGDYVVLSLHRPDCAPSSSWSDDDDPQPLLRWSGDTLLLSWFQRQWHSIVVALTWRCCISKLVCGRGVISTLVFLPEWGEGKTQTCVLAVERKRESREREKDGGKSVIHKYGYRRFGPPIRARLHIVT